MKKEIEINIFESLGLNNTLVVYKKSWETLAKVRITLSSFRSPLAPPNPCTLQRVVFFFEKNRFSFKLKFETTYMQRRMN